MRIRVFSDTQKILVNKPMMLLHTISYMLFVLSMLLYLFVYAAQQANVVNTMTVIICITTLASEVILVFIFMKISGNKVKHNQIKTNSTRKKIE